MRAVDAREEQDGSAIGTDGRYCCGKTRAKCALCRDQEAGKKPKKAGGQQQGMDRFPPLSRPSTRPHTAGDFGFSFVFIALAV
jgi:hypothetical protein